MIRVGGLPVVSGTGAWSWRRWNSHAFEKKRPCWRVHWHPALMFGTPLPPWVGSSLLRAGATGSPVLLPERIRCSELEVNLNGNYLNWTDLLGVPEVLIKQAPPCFEVLEFVQGIVVVVALLPNPATGTCLYLLSQYVQENFHRKYIYNTTFKTTWIHAETNDKFT